MNEEQIKQRLQQQLPDCVISVSGADGHFDILAVGERFGGMSRVKRQQTVYAALGDAITSGSVHAVNIRAIEPGEAAAS